jgi:tRNA (cytidine/uridine-2'-O-)-methyltransferase
MKTSRIFVCTTKSKNYYTDVNFEKDDVFIFGPETRGLPQEILNMFSKKNWLKIPMRDNSRSLNLSNAVAVILYEAWRQLEFK